MLKLPLQGFFLRALPEGFLGIFAVYAFSGVRVNVKRFIIASFTFGVAMYLIRCLPIKFGIHTMIGILINIIIAFQINKIEIISSITSSLLYVVCLAIGEALTVPFITSYLNMTVEELLDSSMSNIAGIPSLIFVLLIVFGTYSIKKRFNKLK